MSKLEEKLSFLRFMRRVKRGQGLALIFLITTVFTSCATGKVSKVNLFDQAVNDASVVEKKDINTDLVPITPENGDLIWNSDKTRVLMVAWKSQGSYEKFYKGQSHTSSSEDYVTWVTAAPQVKTFMKSYLKKHPDATKADIDLRLKQYLGLKPEWNYDVFIEFWVKPDELFRPCVDPEITDKMCNIKFAKQMPAVKGIDSYPDFYRKLYFDDFRERPGIPWTGMGYTYDWGNPVSAFGASEFIMIPGASLEIRSVTKTLDYLK